MLHLATLELFEETRRAGHAFQLAADAVTRLTRASRFLAEILCGRCPPPESAGLLASHCRRNAWPIVTRWPTDCNFFTLIEGPTAPLQLTGS